jgi:hypothetical protein
LSFRSEAEESAFALACPFLFVIPEGNLLFVRSHMHYTNDENALGWHSTYCSDRKARQAILACDIPQTPTPAQTSQDCVN